MVELTLLLYFVQILYKVEGATATVKKSQPRYTTASQIRPPTRLECTKSSFEAEGELLQREPELKNRKTPDFLIEDDEGNRCYVEAKVRHNSIEKDRYFDDWIVGTLMQHKSVDGKGVGVQRVSGTPDNEPDAGRLLQEIYDWLGTFSLRDLQQLKDRELRCKIFSFPSVEIELVATRAHNSGRLFTYVSRSRSGTIRGDKNTWLSEKARDATKKYRPELLGGVVNLRISVS